MGCLLSIFVIAAGLEIGAVLFQVGGKIQGRDLPDDKIKEAAVLVSDLTPLLFSCLCRSSFLSLGRRNKWIIEDCLNKEVGRQLLLDGKSIDDAREVIAAS